MQIVCPVCGYSNQVVSNYEPGSVLSCACGEFMEFVGDGEPPRLIPKNKPAYPASTPVPKGKPKAS